MSLSILNSTDQKLFKSLLKEGGRGSATRSLASLTSQSENTKKYLNEAKVREETAKLNQAAHLSDLKVQGKKIRSLQNVLDHFDQLLED